MRPPPCECPARMMFFLMLYVVSGIGLQIGGSVQMGSDMKVLGAQTFLVSCPGLDEETVDTLPFNRARPLLFHDPYQGASFA